MEVFELNPTELTTGKRIRREMLLFLYLQIILLVFFGINITMEISLIVMYFLLISLRRQRILYQLCFNDQENKLEIRYFYLIFIRRKKVISYEKLGSRRLLKRFGLGNSVETLEFLNGKEYVGEIRLNGNWVWEESTFRAIENKIQEIAPIKN